MIVDLSHYWFFVRPGKTDLRKGVNGLSVLIQDAMEHDLFCNGQRRLLKIVYWDRNGFCLWQKRLQRDKFPWPQDEAAAREIEFEELRMLLDGIDFFKAHQRLTYSRV